MSHPKPEVMTYDLVLDVNGSGPESGEIFELEDIDHFDAQNRLRASLRAISPSTAVLRIAFERPEVWVLRVSKRGEKLSGTCDKKDAHTNCNENKHGP